MARPNDRGLNLRWSLLALAAMLAGCADVAGPGSRALPTAGASPHVLIDVTAGTRTVDHIYLGDANGGSVVRLTTGTMPAWSPDGSRLAFSRDGWIYVIGVDGRDEVRLGAGGTPSWSPDGRKIAFASAYGIEVMNADGTGVTPLLPHLFRTDTYEPWDMGVSKPAWSPDGSRIAFEHMGDGDMVPAEIFIMNADGSNPQRLSQSTCCRFAESDPSWAPDGKRVVFWSFGFGIAWSNVADGVASRLYANFPFVAYGAKPAWSPAGQRIAFNSYRFSAKAPPSLYVMSENGGPLTLLFENAHSASWSPDGSRIAFVRTTTAKSK